ncbi:hypothetical protein FOL47_006474 [Perkinsus chesapeaki]|uniref:K Homology domain-containing protein n=1 Tax=Perkinsus chesapeaki TaxID=330153 RepID=A0A7J6LRW6_PERCH|nr:hypothetical protein FOL47_006474 [Perkinsus chesapeaki]
MLQSSGMNVSTRVFAELKRARFFAGPYWFKMLLSDKQASAVIGRGGGAITSIEHRTKTVMKISPPNTYFPGTNMRILVASADHVDALCRVCGILVDEYLSTNLGDDEFFATEASDPTSHDTGIYFSLMGMASFRLGLTAGGGAIFPISPICTYGEERVVRISFARCGNQRRALSLACKRLVMAIQSDKANVSKNIHVMYGSHSPSKSSSRSYFSERLPASLHLSEKESPRASETTLAEMVSNSYTSLSLVVNGISKILVGSREDLLTSALCDISIQTCTDVSFREVSLEHGEVLVVAINGALGAVHLALERIVALTSGVPSSSPFGDANIDTRLFRHSSHSSVDHRGF